ncbi:hypothetical protein EJ08DRAFT_595955 [Tothia fuscella]|uniref:Uncharacterized protein n=1 Tax=Tothia fuscella TaxID=1048955 RepID=A0A9P4NJ34_9PEZI|nr:hypothetical protein EJ08DRAFT_595955 [Tothia fuscella]
MSNNNQWWENNLSYENSSLSSQTGRSQYSDHSFSTAPTIYSDRPRLPHGYETCRGRVENYQEPSRFESCDLPRDSSDTYTSTLLSDNDEFSEDEGYMYEPLEFVEEDHDFDPNRDAIPSTPKDFARLFPSSTRLSIRHDDSTKDGNMNLRVDTNARKLSYTLFHLKMQDLRSREFSLRRYCRDSGREVCHSIRKYHSPVFERRTSLHKSFSSALCSFKKHNDPRDKTVGSLNRNDSGYGSIYDGQDNKSGKYFARTEPPPHLPTNTIKLEFSNYAHINLKRRGAGPDKKYEFEYWGVKYTWKRRVNRECSFDEVSYHLIWGDQKKPLAHIVPVLLTRSQVEEESRKGGWVPPCSMWITDESVQISSELAELVISTGLIALVDDSIKRRWHSTTRRQLLLPLVRSTPFRMELEYIGPKRLIDEVFNRRS